MNKNMDVNFAFAILLLVAAIVGMYFWLENANEEVGDIYNEEQNVVVQRSIDTEEVTNEDEDGVVSNVAGELE